MDTEKIINDYIDRFNFDERTQEIKDETIKSIEEVLSKIYTIHAHTYADHHILAMGLIERIIDVSIARLLQ